MEDDNKQSAPGSYQSWEINRRDFSGQLRDFVKWAILAPSSHNTQPWIFAIEEDSIIISPDPLRHLKASDPTGRQMYFSLGAAVANLRLASTVVNMDTEDSLIYLKDGRLSKRIKFSEKPESLNDEDIKSFYAITRRISNRGPHEAREIPESVKKFMQKIKDIPSLDISLIEDKEGKTKIAHLVAEGDAQILEEGPFTVELSAWVKPNFTKDPDGMPGFGWKMSDYMSTLFPSAARSGAMAKVAPDSDFKLLSEQTAAIGVISTDEDIPEAWYKAGEEFQKIALKAASLGLSANVLAVLVEIGDYHQDLKEITAVKGRPQIMFRLGYPTEQIQHAPRRHYKDVILSGPSGAEEVTQPHQPRIFTFSSEYDIKKLEKDLVVYEVVDRYVMDLGELFIIRNPDRDFRKSVAQQELIDYVASRDNHYDGKWVYFPWDRRVRHILEEDEFYEVLFSRNKPCITAPEQQLVKNLRVAIAGLSVGRCIAKEAAALGVSHLYLADPDIVSLSNTPRMGTIRGGEIGENKTLSTAHALYEFNPYLDLKLYPEGVSPENLPEIMQGVDVFIDHMESLPMKLRAREIARQLNKIVLMATDTDKTPIFDVETPDNPILFGGRVNDLNRLKSKPEELKDWINTASEVMGRGNLPTRLMQNFLNVASDRQKYPSQLGMTGSVVAGYMAYFLFEIARGNANKLPAFKKVEIEEPNLKDQEEYTAIKREFDKVFNKD